MEHFWKKNMVILWIGVFLCSTAYSIAVPFIPLFLQAELDVDRHLEMWSGLTFGITYLTAAIIAPFWGSLADKYGRKPMIIRSGFSLSVLYFATFFVHNVYLFLIVRIFQGLLAGFVPSSIALVATNTPEKEVGYALGVMATATATGNIVGPLIGGLLSQFIGTRAAFMASGFAVLAGVLIVLFTVKESNFNRNAARPRILDDLKEAFGNRKLISVLGLALIISTSVMILEPLLTIYVLQIGGNVDKASFHSGIIFSAVGIATIIMAPRWGRIGQKISYTKTLFIGLLGGGIGSLAQIFTENLVGFGMLRFGYGLFFAAVYPAMSSLIVNYTEPGFRGRAFSLNQSASQLGFMIGPIMGGFLGGWLGIHAVFVINGLTLIIFAVVYRLRWQ